ncbi:MAG: ATP-dependent RecD-like DNA helicase [Candidatus Babeliaceae bacterium]|nr:ATP-dependent RecD-like DNA helicase [Candidatus Babeliaceae bacterium]
MEQQNEIIKGTIERFLFKNNENGYVIFVIHSAGEPVTVTGSLPTLASGQEVELEGSWITHPRFGRQFQAKRAISQLPTSVVGLKKYLGSGLIHGIGKVYAEKLVDYFGANVLTIIDKTPERLAEVPGLGPKRIDSITSAWHEQRSVASIMVFLQEKGVSPSYAAKIYKQYGNRSLEVVQQNPYRLAEDIWGIGFATADTIAQHLGFAIDSSFRLASGCLYTLKMASGQGHLYLEREQLINQTQVILKIEGEENNGKLALTIDNLLIEGKLSAISQTGTTFYALSSHHATEIDFARRLTRLNSFVSAHHKQKNFDYDALYRQLRVAHGSIDLNEDQQHGILATLQSKVSIITGGPGTGKTTLVRALLSILDAHHVSYKLAAPTGRAAKRLAESTGHYAMTLHRLLEFDPSTMRFTHNETNAIKADFFIIDETSMVDIFLAHSLVRAIPLTAHLVLIGDSDQLPSVGPGNVLKDLIASKRIACTRLTEIFRQAQSSMIVVNAHQINRGAFPKTRPEPGDKRDFIFINERDPQLLLGHLKKILFIDLKKHSLKPKDTHVLVPMNRGIAGTFFLNSQLQALLNPISHPLLKYRGIEFREGDRVMQIKNNYEKLVFNGDIGYIEEVREEEGQLSVLFGNQQISYKQDELDELVLAYASTIHKSQGSEYPAVIIPLFMQHFMLLQRNLLYTAITRAKKVCFLVGEPRAVALAVKKSGGLERITFLSHFMQTSTTNESGQW